MPCSPGKTCAAALATICTATSDRLGARCGERLSSEYRQPNPGAIAIAIDLAIVI